MLVVELKHHAHTILSICFIGVDPGKIMAELCMKDGGTCRGAGGSMHIYVSTAIVIIGPCCFLANTK